ncbi:MAG: Type IV pili component [Magnetospirillum sp.]|nr:MAG: Type IV pili component [Magnetospirillum sp.]
MKTPSILIAALLALAACSEPMDMAIHDHHQRYPFQVESRSAVATLAAAGERGFSRDDLAVLADLAREHVKRGAGAIAVTGAEAERAAAELVRLGIDAASLSVKAAEGATEVRVPVWVAIVPECGNFAKPLNPDWENAPNSNYGCSIQRNIGLMVSNPADLVRAREPSGRDGQRAADILDKYSRGQATGSVREGASTLSTVGGSTTGGN